MPKLRDGSKNKDPRLTRIVKFDEKSRLYPVLTTDVLGQAPRSYTWKCDQWLDQGQEGACVGFAVTHELIAKPSVVTGLDAKFAIERIYWEAQKSDEWPGGSYPGAKPAYEGTSVLDGIKAAQKLGYIKEYRWAFGLNDLVLAVGHVGPAVLGINWYDGMFDVQQCGYLHVSGKVAGGHAILCNGVDVKRKTFNLHNSWGPGWGVGGDATISWDDMERLLKEDGEACIPTVRSSKPGLLTAVRKLLRIA